PSSAHATNAPLNPSPSSSTPSANLNRNSSPPDAVTNYEEQQQRLKHVLCHAAAKVDKNSCHYICS
ncbi:MAG TPA: hypothetical protein VHZ24_13790, partial [Pirellulales bacterium]|nr:hypothetical protein [Pirellulales bacterium]